jgi:hypothetical protein
MEDKKDPQLTRDESLHAENNLLKLKLSMEHGMQQMGDTNSLSPEMENQWLKQVYAFEQQFRDAKSIQLYDYLGRPEYMKWDTLTPEKTTEELKRIRSIMAVNDIDLDCICSYDDAVIYKFITEELFLHEMDDMRIPGMVYHFIYEEFHPNHDYDVRRHAGDFLKSVFEKEWNEEFDQLALARNVTFEGKSHSRADISAIITTFQEAHDSSDIARLDITEVIINTEVTTADVRALLSVSATQNREQVVYEGGCSFHFTIEDGYWYIDAFDVPGMGGG